MEMKEARKEKLEEWEANEKKGKWKGKGEKKGNGSKTTGQEMK